MENFFNDSFEYSIFKKALKNTQSEPVILNILSSDSSLQSEPEKKAPVSSMRKNMSEKFEPSPFGKYFGQRKKRNSAVDMSDFSSWKNKNYRKIEQASKEEEQTKSKPFSLADYLKSRSTQRFNELDQAKSDLKKPINQLSTDDPDYKKYSLDSYMNKLEEGIIAKNKFEKNDDLLEPISQEENEVVQTGFQDEDFSRSNVNVEKINFDEISGDSFSLNKDELDEVKDRLEKLEKRANNVKDKPNQKVLTGDEFKDEEDEEDEEDEKIENSSDEDDPFIIKPANEFSESQSDGDVEKDEEKGSKKYYEVNMNEDSPKRKIKTQNSQENVDEFDDENLDESFEEENENSDENLEAEGESLDENSDENLKSDDENLSDERDLESEDEEANAEQNNFGEDEEFDEEKQRNDETLSNQNEENSNVAAKNYDNQFLDDDESGLFEGDEEFEERLKRQKNLNTQDDDYDLDSNNSNSEPYNANGNEPYDDSERSQIYSKNLKRRDILTRQDLDEFKEEIINKFSELHEKNNNGESEIVGYSEHSHEDDLGKSEINEYESKIAELEEQNKKTGDEVNEKIRLIQEEKEREYQEYQERLKKIEEQYNKKYEEFREKMLLDKISNEKRIGEFQAKLKIKESQLSSKTNTESSSISSNLILGKELKANHNISNLEMNNKLLLISNKLKKEEEKVLSQTHETKKKTSMTSTQARNRRRRGKSKRRIDSDIIGGINFD